MQPTTIIQKQIAILLAGDTTTLAAAGGLVVHLAKQAFTPSTTLDPTTLVSADFDGYTALLPTPGPQIEYWDPVSGLYTVEIKEPAGGWHYQCTGPGNLPQTIYGWFVTDSTNTKLYGSGLLDTPVPMTGAGQGLNLPTLQFAFSNNSPM